MIALLRPGQHRQLIIPEHHDEAVPDGQSMIPARAGIRLRHRAEGQLLQQAVGAALQQAQHQLAVLLRHEIHRAAELLLLQGHHLLAGDIQGVHQLGGGTARGCCSRHHSSAPGRTTGHSPPAPSRAGAAPPSMPRVVRVPPSSGRLKGVKYMAEEIPVKS